MRSSRRCGPGIRGYHVRIDATGYEEELDDCRAALDRLAREEDKLKTQLDNARTTWWSRASIPRRYFGSAAKSSRLRLRSWPGKERHWRAMRDRLAAARDGDANLIPKTEALLESYDRMTNRERNTLLKAILRRIEYEKGP